MQGVSRQGAALCCALLSIAAAGPARAQFGALSRGPASGKTEPANGNQPVTFEADRVNYDRDHGIVSAEGHVEAWQNDHLLRADRITFDRNTNVAAAYGHVVIVEPDGEIIFADYAELTQGMKNGVLRGMRALLQQNGKLAANGARRIEGKLNVLSRGVYTTCNLCAKDPFEKPLWQLRAYNVTQDLENKRIEYTDAWLDFMGLPVLYLPYFSNADPSVKRQSGFLVPSIGITDKHLGSFVSTPYYYVIDDQSDLTLTPLLATDRGPQLGVDYRRDFNSGVIRTQGAVADDYGLAGYIFAHATFVWDDEWRYGADINLASSVDYMRDFRIPGYGANELASTVYAEGFGVGAYSRLSATAFQGLNSLVVSSQLPYALPRYQYDFFGEPDVLGGRVSFDTDTYNILRDFGTKDQRIAGTLAWNRTLSGPVGDQWLFTVQAAGAAYHASGLTQPPNYGPDSEATTVHAQPQVAVRLSWPLLRDTTGTPGSLGSQVIEPIVQVIAGPQQGNSMRDKIPNEDSLTYEFTDATLFNLNRFGGYDRFDGGVRVNYALHASWTFPGQQRIDALIGESWQQHIAQDFYPQFQPWNGFAHGAHLSDIVSRVSFVPNTWLDFTARGRFDKDSGTVRFADVVGSIGQPILRVSAGYFHGNVSPYLLYSFDYALPGALLPQNSSTNANTAAFFTPRDEATGTVSTHFGHWTLSANAERDLYARRLITAGADIKYDDECFTFDGIAVRRYTSIDNDRGDTTILFLLNFKSVGQFGING